MNSLLMLPRGLLAAGFAAVTMAVPFGLYALLTRTQRRVRRELRRAAQENGWQYHRRWWQGNPMGFRMDGRSPSGLEWKLTSGSRNSEGSGWTTELTLRFPTLGGETDVGLAPRVHQQESFRIDKSTVPSNVEGRIAAFSLTLAGAVHFMANAEPVASGSPEFDKRYEVRVSAENAGRPLVDAAFAEQILRWPAEAVPVHSILAWRDPFGFVVEARLSRPPNWATVSHLLELGNTFVQRLPPAKIPAARATRLDNLIGRVLR